MSLPDKTPEHALSIILVNYNGGLFLQVCLAAVRERIRDMDVEVVVVDNGSTDGSPAAAAAAFPWARIIRNEGNPGFGAANNRGWRACRGEHILFMNTDVVLGAGTLERLRDVLDEDPAVGAAGPALLQGPGIYQVSYGKKNTFFRELFRKSLLNRRLRRTAGRGRNVRPVDWVSGAFLLVRREALEAVGGFDEKFFLYFEDIDLCLRIKTAGWKVVYAPGAPSFHEGGASAAAAPLRARYEYRKSQILFYRRHNSGLSLILLKAYLGLSFLFLPQKPPPGRETDPARSDFLRLLKNRGDSP